MTKQEAIEMLKTICGDCRLFPKCAYKKSECFTAIDMAIEALKYMADEEQFWSEQYQDIDDYPDDELKGILTPEERSEVLNAIDDALNGYQVDGYEDTDGMFFKVLISKMERGDSGMSRRTDLPIMLGKNLKKGILLFQDKKMGGINMLVVWLNRTVESGSNFDMSDIDKVNAVIHFCDKDTLKLTIDTLTRAWENWKDGEADE